MAGGWQLAQYNVARALWPSDSPEMADFFARVPAIHALAEVSPGYVWRNTEHESDPAKLTNLTVWESIEALREFTYRSAHAEVFRARERWFEKPELPHQVLWWVAAGHRPSMEEGETRLAAIRTNGPTADAFTFARAFPPPA